MQYPHPCSRCGFCCIAEVCPMGQKIYDIPAMVKRHVRCPGLKFNDDGEATCEAVTHCRNFHIPEDDLKEAFGIGKGCCIKARAFKDDKEYDFAALPPALKKLAVKQLREAE